MDAFEYIGQQMPQQKFDYAFVDLWHDVSDGLELYLKIKRWSIYVLIPDLCIGLRIRCFPVFAGRFSTG